SPPGDGLLLGRGRGPWYNDPRTAPGVCRPGIGLHSRPPRPRPRDRRRPTGGAWPMPFDGLFTAAIAAELNATLADARIHKIQQPDTRTLVFHCRRPGQTHRLLIGADPAHPRAHLIDVPPPNPPHPPAFCMLLRKHLEPARILQVVQEGLDRILQMVCEAVDEAGRRVRLVLVAELTGRHSNVILIEEAGGRILDALHRVAAAPGVRRVLMPGETYEPPPVP